MAEMGKYCKAYLAKQFREYPGWTEKKENVRKEKKEVDGKEVEVERELERRLDPLSPGELRRHRRDLQGPEHHLRQRDRRVAGVLPRNLSFEIPVYEPINISASGENTPAAEGSQNT